jgi:hypothetical protein
MGQSIEELEAIHKDLVARRATLVQGKLTIEAELASRKRALKELMDEAKKAGFNPDDLPEEIRKAREILVTKMDILSSEIKESEQIMKPLIQEIEKV